LFLAERQLQKLKGEGEEKEMKDLKIRTRLLICFGITVLMTLFVAYAGMGTLMSSRKGHLSEDYLQKAEISVGIIAGIAIAITLFLAFRILKDIRVSMTMLSEAAKQFASGRTDIVLKKLHNDEFGDLVDDFQKIVNNVKYQAEIAGNITTGNLDLDVKVKGNGDVLGNAFQSMIDENNHMLSGIRESSIQLSMGAEQVSDASQSLAQGSTQQASAIQQVTASITEIAERTKRNAEEANQANASVHSMKEEAMVSDSHMKEMIGAMTEINEASENISKIIKVIDDIAFQTNILALNAAVEAARAGVHGKGFAVVAEEVRNLAGKSASAASETADMIEDSIKKVEQGSKLAEQTAASLTQIIGEVDNIVALINNIAVASNDQATAVSQIDQAIIQVSQVVQTNSATSEQCAAASEELSNQAMSLRTMIGQYKLKGAENYSPAVQEISMSDKSEENERIISLDGEFGKY